MALNPDRIRVIEVADRRPMHDLYDKDFEGPVLDLGVNLDRFFGHIFIKVSHFEFIAREHVGMATKKDYDNQTQIIAEQVEIIKQLHSDLNELKAERQESFNAKLDEFLANYAGAINHVAGSVPPLAINDTPEQHPATDLKAKAKGSGGEGNLDGL